MQQHTPSATPHMIYGSVSASAAGTLASHPAFPQEVSVSA